jgi:hypothetical protein
MNQYRITFKHSPQVCGEFVHEFSGSVLVAAESSAAAREKFLREIQKRLSLSIVSVGYVDSFDDSGVPAEA